MGEAIYVKNACENVYICVRGIQKYRYYRVRDSRRSVRAEAMDWAIPRVGDST